MFHPGYKHSAKADSCEPTRYESVGCDGENFSSLKEYEAKGEVFDAANFVRFVRSV